MGKNRSPDRQWRYVRSHRAHDIIFVSAKEFGIERPKARLTRGRLRKGLVPGNASTGHDRPVLTNSDDTQKSSPVIAEQLPLTSNYHYYRTYDPATGRYRESDPIGLNGGPNTYAFVGSMPMAELRPLLSALESAGNIGVQLGLLFDLATERPADALASLEAIYTECIGVTEIPDTHGVCPDELIRVYQELGDNKAAQILIDADVHRYQVFRVAEDPLDYQQFSYAGKFATGGSTDLAFDLLEEWVSSGWRGNWLARHSGSYLRCDVVFDAISDHERFRAIVATIKADMAQQLVNVREMQQIGEVPTLEEVTARIASTQESG